MRPADEGTHNSNSVTDDNLRSAPALLSADHQSPASASSASVFLQAVPDPTTDELHCTDGLVPLASGDTMVSGCHPVSAIPQQCVTFDWPDVASLLAL